MASKQLIFTFIFACIMNSLQGQVDPQLDRYKVANSQLETLNSEEVRVVFLGNSITEGWVQDSLSLFKNKSYINRGISGQTTPQMKGRFTQDVIALKPSIVVILAGINDIAQNTGFITIPNIAANIETMTKAALDQNIHVVICSVLPANTFPWRPDILPADKVIALNALLKEIAKKHKVTYLDYYSPMVDDQKGLKQAYTYDGVHCTVQGYKVMENLIQECLNNL